MNSKISTSTSSHLYPSSCIDTSHWKYGETNNQTPIEVPFTIICRILSFLRLPLIFFNCRLVCRSWFLASQHRDSLHNALRFVTQKEWCFINRRIFNHWLISFTDLIQYTDHMSFLLFNNESPTPIQSFTKLESLEIDYLDKHRLDTLLEKCPQLKELKTVQKPIAFGVHGSRDDFIRLEQLSRFHLRRLETVNIDEDLGQTLAALGFAFPKLQVLTVGVSLKTTSNDLLRLVRRCPSLHTLRIVSQSLHQIEPEEEEELFGEYFEDDSELWKKGLLDSTSDELGQGSNQVNSSLRMIDISCTIIIKGQFHPNFSLIEKLRCPQLKSLYMNRLNVTREFEPFMNACCQSLNTLSIRLIDYDDVDQLSPFIKNLNHLYWQMNLYTGSPQEKESLLRLLENYEKNKNKSTFPQIHLFLSGSFRYKEFFTPSFRIPNISSIQCFNNEIMRYRSNLNSLDIYESDLSDSLTLFSTQILSSVECIRLDSCYSIRSLIQTLALASRIQAQHIVMLRVWPTSIERQKQSQDDILDDLFGTKYISLPKIPESGLSLEYYQDKDSSMATAKAIASQEECIHVWEEFETDLISLREKKQLESIHILGVASPKHIIMLYCVVPYIVELNLFLWNNNDAVLLIECLRHFKHLRTLKLQIGDNDNRFDVISIIFQVKELLKQICVLDVVLYDYNRMYFDNFVLPKLRKISASSLDINISIQNLNEHKLKILLE